MSNDPEFTTITNLDSVPATRGLTVPWQGGELAVFRQGDCVHVIDGRCPHRGGPLGEATLQGERIACPLHGWEFNVTDGSCLDRPDKPVTVYEARVVDGQVQIRI